MYWRGLSSIFRIGQTSDSPQYLRPSTARRQERLQVYSVLIVGFVLLNGCAAPSLPRGGEVASGVLHQTESSTGFDSRRAPAPRSSKGLARYFKSASESLEKDTGVDVPQTASALRRPPQASPEANPGNSSVVLASATEALPPAQFGRSDGTAQQEMTLDEVFLYALENHPLLRARQSEVDIARAQLVTAGLVTNPQFTMDTESPIGAGGRTDMSTRLIFTIPTAGKIRHRQAVAQEAIRRSQIALAVESELVLVEAADAANEVLYLQHLLVLGRQLEEITAERAQGIPETLPGTVPQPNFVNKVEAEIDAVDARTQRLETTRLLAVARGRLALAIGLDPSMYITIRGTLDVDPAPLLPLEKWVDLARANSPSLADAFAAESESESQHDLAWAESVPDIELGPRYQDSLGEKDDRIGARFQVDVPVFDRNQGVILESAAQVRANRAMTRVAQINSLHAVVVAHAELQSIQEAARYYKTEVEAMIRRNQQLVEDPAVRGVIRVDQALEIRQDLLDLELTYLQLRYRYNQLRTQLEVLLGEPITVEEELVAPPRPFAAAAAHPR